MSIVTKVWENVERPAAYYECGSVFPDPGVMRHLPVHKIQEVKPASRSKQSLLTEAMQWVRIDMYIRLMGGRI